MQEKIKTIKEEIAKVVVGQGEHVPKVEVLIQF